MSEPLKVRCARALGCTPLIYNSGRAECLCADYRHAVDPGLVLKPYGEDSPEGWACTGPLIGEFDLRVERSNIDLGRGLWRAARNRSKTDADGMPWIIGPDAPHACAAIAEWVAEWGARHAPQVKL